MGVTPIGMPEGEGTEDDPLRIENAEQLAWFAQTISDPEQGAQGGLCGLDGRYRSGG